MTKHRLPIAALIIGALLNVTVLSEQALAMSAAEKLGEQVRVTMMGIEVGRATRVSVKLRNGSTVVGYLAAVRDHSFLVTDPETQVSTQVPYRNVRQISAMSTGAKVVIAAGVVAAIIVILACAAGRGCFSGV